MRYLLNVIILTSVFGCSNMFSARSFQDEMERNSENFWSPNDDFPVVSGDSGSTHRTRREVYARTPGSVNVAAKEQQTLKLEEEIEAKIDQLSEEERGEYKSSEKYLENNSEKAYYLSLSKYKRWSYVAEKKGKQLGTQEYSTLDYLQIRQTQNGRLDLGMSKDEVLSKLGRPGQIDVAGDPRNENERWSFNQGKFRKYIYFESGKVQGWSQD